MTKQVPEQFSEIARLSDEELSEQTYTAIPYDKAAAGEKAIAAMKADFARGGPKPVDAYLKSMDDQSFRELMGWTIFGRDYRPSAGDPSFVLARYIREAVIHPRDSMEGYLSNKPIGEYLRTALHRLLTTTSEDIEREGGDRQEEERERSRRFEEEEREIEGDEY